MYKLNFAKDMLVLNWCSIYWGIETDLIEASNAIEYCSKIIENNQEEDTEAIIKLLIADTLHKEDVLSLLRDVISDDKLLKDSKDLSLRIIRYAILKDMQRNIRSNRKLLTAVESVYADFNYPADMEEFVLYMPLRETDYDVSEHTREENEQRLVDKFNIFMNNEFEWILNANRR